MAATASRNIETDHPESKALSSWFARFKPKPSKKESDPTRSMSFCENRNFRANHLGIFSVPLQESITYANVAISLYNDEGTPFIYGYIPIVVAKCGLFLKENATETEGIFRLSGSAKRIKDLQVIFDQPPKYGKLLDWEGFTVHDAANILRRYLNHLPDPIIPFDWYDSFREPIKQNWALEQAIPRMQDLVASLPALNRQLLLYILDLLAVFASKADINRMTSENLSAIFQPGLLTHPRDDMAPQEYRLSQEVLVFLIDNQSNFLLDMCPPTQEAKAESPSSQKKGLLRRRTLQSTKHSPEAAKTISTRSDARSSPLRSTTPIGVVNISRSNTLPSKRSVPKDPEASDPIVPRHVSSPMVGRSTAPISVVASIPESSNVPHLMENSNSSTLHPVASKVVTSSVTSSKTSLPLQVNQSATASSLNASPERDSPSSTGPPQHSVSQNRPVSMFPNYEHGAGLDQPIKAREIKPSSSPSRFGNLFKKKQRAQRESQSSGTTEVNARRDLDE